MPRLSEPAPGTYARVAMAAFAYVLPPVTGLIAYLSARDERGRMHGLQAITIGVVWPVLLYAAALGPPVAVQAIFVAGALVWLGFLVLALFGRDPVIPLIGKKLRAAAALSVKDAPRNTSGT